jgi:hypothetical protein
MSDFLKEVAHETNGVCISEKYCKLISLSSRKEIFE